MKPKEKAKELVEKFYSLDIADGEWMSLVSAKQCALICVGEMRKFSHKHAHKDLADLQELDEIEQEISKL